MPQIADAIQTVDGMDVFYCPTAADSVHSAGKVLEFSDELGFILRKRDILAECAEARACAWG